MSVNSALVSLLAGLAVTVGVGLAPTARAARLAPLAALRETAAEARRMSRARAVVGAALAAAGVGVVFAGTGGGGRSVAATLAGRNVGRNPRRTASAATALMIGVAVVTLFTVYAASLRAADVAGVDKAFTAAGPGGAVLGGARRGGRGGRGDPAGAAAARLPMLAAIAAE